MTPEAILTLGNEVLADVLLPAGFVLEATEGRVVATAGLDGLEVLGCR